MLSSYFFVKLVTFDIIPILLIFCSKVIIQLMCDGKKSIGFCANHSLSGRVSPDSEFEADVWGA